MLPAHYLKLKEGPVLVKKRCLALDFFYKGNMRHGLALGYKNQTQMMILLPLLSHNNLVSFYCNKIREEK